MSLSTAADNAEEKLFILDTCNFISAVYLLHSVWHQ